MEKLGNDWDKLLKSEFLKPYYKKMQDFLEKEYATQNVYPPKEDIFNSLKLTPYEQIKVVILGQDPYHNKGQAHGLSFSVNKGELLPPSLLNIYKEIEREFTIKMPRQYGQLSGWAQQGVLLLNTVLTVRQNQPNSHKETGWQTFTDNIIKQVNAKDTPCVFLLWGNNARQKEKLITNKNHLVLTAAHPSPLSAYKGFFGCDHFIKANDFLQEHSLKAINWQIKE